MGNILNAFRMGKLLHRLQRSFNYISSALFLSIQARREFSINWFVAEENKKVSDPRSWSFIIFCSSAPASLHPISSKKLQHRQLCRSLFFSWIWKLNANGQVLVVGKTGDKSYSGNSATTDRTWVLNYFVVLHLFQDNSARLRLLSDNQKKSNFPNEPKIAVKLDDTVTEIQFARAWFGGRNVKREIKSETWQFCCFNATD